MSRAKDRLRGKGIAACEVSASRVILVPHTALVMAPKGAPLFDPRSLDPVREDMAQDMAARVQAGDIPNTDAILVREQPDGLLIVDGHGRGKALVRAAEILGFTGSTHLMALVEFFTGDDKALLLERARRNDHGKFARADKPSTLAFRVRQLTAIGATEREIADACPRGVGPAEVEALTRWNNLGAEARQRFEDGAFPLGILAAVLEAPKGEQVARGEKLVAAGVKSARGATRKANEEKASRDPWARRMSPKALVRAANALMHHDDLTTISNFHRDNGGWDGPDELLRMCVSVALRVAAHDGKVGALVKLLPPTIADLIREARAAKPAKGAR